MVELCPSVSGVPVDVGLVFGEAAGAPSRDDEAEGEAPEDKVKKQATLERRERPHGIIPAKERERTLEPVCVPAWHAEAVHGPNRRILYDGCTD